MRTGILDRRFSGPRSGLRLGLIASPLGKREAETKLNKYAVTDHGYKWRQLCYEKRQFRNQRTIALRFAIQQQVLEFASCVKLVGQRSVLHCSSQPSVLGAPKRLLSVTRMFQTRH